MNRDHYFLSPPGWHTALGDELGRVFPDGTHRPVSDRWWTVDTRLVESASPSLAFALQALPNALTHQSLSIRKDADAVALLLREEFGSTASPWRLQVFAPLEVDLVTPGKAKLLRSALLEALKRKAKALLPLLRDSNEPASGGESQVQISWLSPSSLGISVCHAPCRRLWRRILSPWSGGVAPVPVDKRPPSRAYRKLLEAQRQIGRSIAANQSVVDLGGSPGGWTFVALNLGAHVVAVDRSHLRDDLMSNPRLHFIAGDAFKFQPATPVDWMLADVAAYPERTFDLVRRWLSSAWCRSLIATIKFTGAASYAILEEFKSMLATEADDFRIRKLLENKNEATIMAWKDTTARKNPGDR